MKRTCFLFVCIFIFSSHLQAKIDIGPHFISLGPESYYIKRKKDGGSWQDGWINGARISYERWKKCGFYWALDGYWAAGSIEGKTKSKKKLKSYLTDYQIEGRIGYSYAFPKSTRVRWIPYAAYGKFCSKNDFKKPSPIPYKITNEFEYYAAGIKTLVQITSCIYGGIHFKYKYPEEPKCKITDDPDYDSLSLTMGRKAQYEIELPFLFLKNWHGKSLALNLTPFYRKRKYGFQENFPFDCIETRFDIWGIRCQLGIMF